MDWILLVLAVGGYGSNTPSISSSVFENEAACKSAGLTAVREFTLVSEIGEPYKFGAKAVKFICVPSR